MEKEKYEKPFIEVITLLNTDIITDSPENPESGDVDPLFGFTAMNKMVQTVLSPWLESEEYLVDEEGNPVLDEEGNPIPIEHNESIETENSESSENPEKTKESEGTFENSEPVENTEPQPESSFMEKLTEGINEVLGTDVGTSEPDYDDESGGAKDFVEEENSESSTPTEESGTEW